MAVGQRYSVMIKLNQMPGDYSLRFATFPTGDMQQVLEGQAVVHYSVCLTWFLQKYEDPLTNTRTLQ